MGVTQVCQLPVFTGFAFTIFMDVTGINDKNPTVRIYQRGEDTPSDKLGNVIATYKDGKYEGENTEQIPPRIKARVEASIKKLNNDGYKNELKACFGNLQNVEEAEVSELTK